MASTQPELISKDIVDLQDIEKVQFLQTLQNDPGKYNAYVQEKSGRILAEVIDTKRASFVKASGDMARMMDMDHNSLAALARSNDVVNMQQNVISNQSSETGALKANDDLTRRQVEINNWYYENKRETLFVLQLLLLVILIVVITLGAVHYEWIGKDAGDYLMGFVIVIGLCTWLYRWYYTSKIRDPRYWNQRSFSQDGLFKPDGLDICLGSDDDSNKKPAS
jgi:hypothetical protein